MPTSRVCTPCSASAASRVRPRSSIGRVSTLRRPDTDSSLAGGSFHADPAAPGGSSISSCSGGSASGPATSRVGSCFFLARLRRGLGGSVDVLVVQRRTHLVLVLCGIVGRIAQPEQPGEPGAGPLQRGRRGGDDDVPHLADGPTRQQAGGQHGQHEQDGQGTPSAEEAGQGPGRAGPEQAAGIGERVHTVPIDDLALAEEDVEHAGDHHDGEHGADARRTGEGGVTTSASSHSSASSYSSSSSVRSTSARRGPRMSRTPPTASAMGTSTSSRPTRAEAKSASAPPAGPAAPA